MNNDNHLYQGSPGTDQTDSAGTEHCDEWVRCSEVKPPENRWVCGLTDAGEVVQAILRNNGDSCYFKTAGDEISEGAIVKWKFQKA